MVCVAICMLFAISSSASAQNRVKVRDGVYLVSYGNTFVIENDNLQRSEPIQVRVEQKKESNGLSTYDLFCGNKVTKGIAKTALSGAIATILTSSGVASWVTPFAGYIANSIYDEVCDYYGSK